MLNLIGDIRVTDKISIKIIIVLNIRLTKYPVDDINMLQYPIHRRTHADGRE